MPFNDYEVDIVIVSLFYYSNNCTAYRDGIIYQSSTITCSKSRHSTKDPIETANRKNLTTRKRDIIAMLAERGEGARAITQGRLSRFIAVLVETYLRAAIMAVQQGRARC